MAHVADEGRLLRQQMMLAQQVMHMAALVDDAAVQVLKEMAHSVGLRLGLHMLHRRTAAHKHPPPRILRELEKLHRMFDHRHLMLILLGEMLQVELLQIHQRDVGQYMAVKLCVGQLKYLAELLPGKGRLVVMRQHAVGRRDDSAQVIGQRA